MQQQYFALVDANSFFCSCEKIFRPDLQNTPVVVLSNNDGCVVSLTRDAKKLGIPMGAPYFKVAELCKKGKVAVFSSNFSLYTNMSARLMAVLETLAPSMEAYSVDEAWLNVTGMVPGIEKLSSEERTRAYQNLGQHIKQTVERSTGLPVSIGLASTKTLTKVANRLAKKSERARGVVDLSSPLYQERALKLTPVEDLWGVGRAWGAKLRALGLYSAWDYAQFPNEVLIEKIFTKIGLQRKWELQGKSFFPLNYTQEKKKEIMVSRTFSKPELDKHLVKEALARYVSSAAEKMRDQGSLCREVHVFMRTSPYAPTVQYNVQGMARIAAATSDTRKLIHLVHNVVDKIFKEGIEYRKVGVVLHDLIDEQWSPLLLFEKGDTPEDIALMSTMDRVNVLNGPQTLHSAACGLAEKGFFHMRRQHKSPNYQGSWDHLPPVF